LITYFQLLICNRYYLCGFPLALLLAFHFELGLLGIWMGNAAALSTAAALALLYVARMDWALEVDLAARRLAT
jgi:MATE family multidrug resistance protein